MNFDNPTDLFIVRIILNAFKKMFSGEIKSKFFYPSTVKFKKLWRYALKIISFQIQTGIM